MKRSPQQTFVLLMLVSVLGVSYSPGEGAEAQNILMEILASGTSWADAEYFGHAFLCVSMREAKEIKEECLGFYPRGGKKGEALIGWPGIIECEHGKNPIRFARIKAIYKTTIRQR